MRAWVYKVNSRRPGRYTGRPRQSPRRMRGRRGWHFDRYFSAKRSRKPYDMGGREWIRSPQSWARLRQVRRGDLFVCYQADERRIYGLARAATGGYESLAGSGRFDSIDFAPRGLRLKRPVSVEHPEARAVFRHIRAFTVPSRGTIHALAKDESRAVLAALATFNPEQRRELQAFALAGGRASR